MSNFRLPQPGDPIKVGGVWVWPDGTKLPVVSGGEGPNDPPAGQGQGQGQGQDQGQPPANQGQPPAGQGQGQGGTGKIDDLTKLDQWAKSWGAKEKAEGRAAVEKEIAEKLGMTLDEAAKLVTAQQEKEREAMTEAERKLDDAKKEREKARAETKEAHALVLDLLKQDALMALGMTREQAKGAVDLVKAEVANTPEATMDNIVAGAGQVKLLYPQLFTQQTGRQGPPHSANGGTPPQGATTGDSPRERALARLRQQQGGRLRIDDPNRGEYDMTRRTL